ncbi:helix-turn-helix domain-containing protein [Paenibacillus odorifer]|uniref:helix-turn-helix domain-containing protein n=1 Tax=Paenibacillus odorifer TaxID=189426 RepID=UPI00096DB432|nr:helix-turn-helix transcriptional regulator [Paenibacillus odorifer]OME55092.1 transcriptional regulator [Paenibacillus odorifer]
MVKVSRGRCLLQDWLDLKGMSQAELSRRTGYAARMISFYCSGSRPMSTNAMYIISRVLGIHMEDLYEWKMK